MSRLRRHRQIQRKYQAVLKKKAKIIFNVVLKEVVKIIVECLFN